MFDHKFTGMCKVVSLAAAVSCGLPPLSIQAAHGPVWETRDGYRVASLPVPAAGRSGFALMPSDATGIRFTNSLPDSRAMLNQNLLNGSGVALGDYDGDGLCDIYLCDLGGTNALYRNLGG